MEQNTDRLAKQGAQGFSGPRPSSRLEPTRGGAAAGGHPGGGAGTPVPVTDAALPGQRLQRPQRGQKGPYAPGSRRGPKPSPPPGPLPT